MSIAVHTFLLFCDDCPFSLAKLQRLSAWKARPKLKEIIGGVHNHNLPTETFHMPYLPTKKTFLEFYR